MRLRVLTYNIHKGFCFYSRQYVLNELREAIRSVNADLVFLQEVMGVHPASSMPSERGEAAALREKELASQFEFLADEIWTHYAYGKNAIYSSGHHGNAILSKHPFSDVENINISTNPLERRGLLHAQIELNGSGHGVHVLCLHLDLLERGRKQQMQELIHRVRGSVPGDAPLIVAGDFNDWNQAITDPLEEFLGLKEAGVQFTGEHARTFPSWLPFLALDRIYVRRFEVVQFHVLKDSPWRKMSDHAAVVTELDFP